MELNKLSEFSDNIYNKNLKNFTPIEFVNGFVELLNTLELTYNNTPLCIEYDYTKEIKKYKNPRPTFEAFDEDRVKIKNYIAETNTATNYTLTHTCLDYETIINKGLIYYIKEIEDLISKTNDPQKTEYGKAMILALKSCEILSKRYLEIIPKENVNLRKALETVPMYPAYDFLSACESLVLMHNIVPMSENSYGSVSIGAMDQFLYKYYLMDKDKYDREYFVNIIAYIFDQLNYNHDGACAVNIGGLKDGVDATNELSYIILEAEKKMLRAAPIITLRTSKKMSDDFILEFINKELFTIGQPTFYSEENCIKALRNRGVSEEDIEKFAISSCMSIVVPGKDISDMWGILINTHSPLEMALNNGKIFSEKYGKYCESKIESIEDIMALYEKYIRELLDYAVIGNKFNSDFVASYMKNPLLSALLEGSRETLTDRAERGVKYYNITTECMAFGNVATAFAVIYEKCFKEKSIELSTLINACKNNYVGYEDLLSEIRKVKKFGENTKEKYTSDWFANWLCELFAKICKEVSFDNINYVPSFHTLDGNVWFGENMKATLDGRLEGMPINKNAGPTLETRDAAHTDIIQSVGNMPQTLITGGQPLDLYFPHNMFSPKQCDKILALIKTYLGLNGLQLQVNSANIDLLKKAHANPELYPNVIVRIGGYSLPFATMTKESREEHIARVSLENSLG